MVGYTLFQHWLVNVHLENQIINIIFTVKFCHTFAVSTQSLLCWTLRIYERLHSSQKFIRRWRSKCNFLENGLIGAFLCGLSYSCNLWSIKIYPMDVLVVISSNRTYLDVFLSFESFLLNGCKIENFSPDSLCRFST